MKQYSITLECSQMEISGKMGTKQLVSSAQHACTSVVGGQKIPS
jgi:hypothetical protein